MTAIADANFGLALGAILILLGILSSLVASRFGAPLLLVFLVLGMLAGEDGPGGLHFGDYRATYLIGSCALAIILFDGGLRTRLSAIRDALAPSVALATWGVAVTAGLIGAFSHLVFGFTWIQGLLLGAIVASTDAAAVFFLLKTGGLQLRPRVGAVLEVESGSNDPVAVFLTLILTEIAVAHGGIGWDTAGELLRQAVLGGAFGLAAGFVSVFLLNRLKLLSGLHPLMVIAIAVAVFGITALLDGSGFLAVYICGLVVGNRPVRAFQSIVNFHDTATWLCQIVMFLMLGLLVTPSRLLEYAVPGLLLAGFLTVVGARRRCGSASNPSASPPLRSLSSPGWACAAPSRSSSPPSRRSRTSRARGLFQHRFLRRDGLAHRPGLDDRAGRPRPRHGAEAPAPSANRLEIDLPGQIEKELVGYAIVADSFVALRPNALPGWLKPVIVVRDGDVRNAAEISELKAGDYAYFLVATERARRLDRMFAPLPPDAVNAAKRPLFGEFPIAGDAPLAEVAAFYELEVPQALAGLTVAEAFLAKHGEKLRAGSRIGLGAFAAVVAKTVEDHKVIKAGLRIEEVVDLAGTAAPDAKRGARDRLRGLAKRLRRAA